jgi:hypothetical protein
LLWLLPSFPQSLPSYQIYSFGTSGPAATQEISATSYLPSHERIRAEPFHQFPSTLLLLLLCLGQVCMEDQAVEACGNGPAGCCGEGLLQGVQVSIT